MVKYLGDFSLRKKNVSIGNAKKYIENYYEKRGIDRYEIHGSYRIFLMFPNSKNIFL